MFDRLEGLGQLLRISETVEPTTFRCAVVSLGELEGALAQAMGAKSRAAAARASPC